MVKSEPKLELNPKISLKMIAEECKWIENLQHNTTRIEEYDISKINVVKQKQHKEKFAHKIKSLLWLWTDSWS